MGTVYRAQDPHLDRTVAVKIPRIDASSQDRSMRLERFQREARSAAQVWHPHVCPIYDVGEHESQPYVVMAYVEGQPLAARLAQRGRFEDVGEAVALIGQVLDALDAIHAHNIVHRDLKPSNIILDASGRAVLTDFGLARPETEAGRLTSDGAIVGTPAYMAPEQAAGQSERIGPWTDLYSVGVVFFELLTGRLPFEGPPLALIDQILREPPPPLSRFRPYLDSRFEDLLVQALAKDPDGRFRSARQFAEALTRLAAPVPTIALSPRPVMQVEAPPPSPATHSPTSANSTNFGTSPLVIWLPPACFVLGAVCCILTFTSQQAYSNGAGVAAGFSFFAGAIVLLVDQLGRWQRQRLRYRYKRNCAQWLMEAAQNGEVARVKNLLASRAEVNDKDNAGRIALMKAAEKGHTAVVRLRWRQVPSPMRRMPRD
jgi:serine/threonine protein kinase